MFTGRAAAVLLFHFEIVNFYTQVSILLQFNYINKTIKKNIGRGGLVFWAFHFSYVDPGLFKHDKYLQCCLVGNDTISHTVTFPLALVAERSQALV